MSMTHQGNEDILISNEGTDDVCRDAHCQTFRKDLPVEDEVQDQQTGSRLLQRGRGRTGHGHQKRNVPDLPDEFEIARQLHNARTRRYKYNNILAKGSDNPAEIETWTKRRDAAAQDAEKWEGMLRELRKEQKQAAFDPEVEGLKHQAAAAQRRESYYDSKIKDGGTRAEIAAWKKIRNEAKAERERLGELVKSRTGEGSTPTGQEPAGVLLRKKKNAQGYALRYSQMIESGGTPEELKEWEGRRDSSNAEAKRYQQMITDLRTAAKQAVEQKKTENPSVQALVEELGRLKSTKYHTIRALESGTPEQITERQDRLRETEGRTKEYQGLLSDLKAELTRLENARRTGVQVDIEKAEARLGELEQRIARAVKELQEKPTSRKGRPEVRQSAPDSGIAVPKPNPVTLAAMDVNPSGPTLENHLRRLESMRAQWDRMSRSHAGTPQQREDWELKRMTMDDRIKGYQTLVDDFKTATEQMDLAQRNGYPDRLQRAQDDLKMIRWRVQGWEEAIADLEKLLEEDVSQGDEVVKKQDDLRRRREAVQDQIEKLNCDIIRLADEIARCVSQRNNLQAEAEQIQRELDQSTEQQQRRVKQKPGTGSGDDTTRGPFKSQLLPDKNAVSSVLQSIPSRVRNAGPGVQKAINGAWPFIQRSASQLPKRLPALPPG